MFYDKKQDEKKLAVAKNAALGTAANGCPDRSIKSNPEKGESYYMGVDLGANNTKVIHPLLKKLRSLPQSEIIELTPEEMKLVILNNWMDEVGVDWKPPFVPTPVTLDNLKPGEFVTIKQWLSHKDRSWVGDLIEVKFVEQGNVFVVIHDKYAHNQTRHRFRFTDVEFERVSPEFVKAHNWLKGKDAA